MEIKKFEAYNYTGPDLMKVDRDKFIEEFIDEITDIKLCGYECNGTTYYPKTGELWLHMDKISKENNDNDYKIVKLDLSDMGIEIGNADWNDDKEQFEDFIPEINLDTNITKEVKNFKKSLGKYNL